MNKPSELVIVFISIFGLWISSVLCESHRFQVKEHQRAHPPLQPELVRIFENCHKKSGTFDLCIKNAFNELRVYFKTGKFDNFGNVRNGNKNHEIETFHFHNFKKCCVNFSLIAICIESIYALN